MLTDPRNDLNNTTPAPIVIQGKLAVAWRLNILRMQSLSFSDVPISYSSFALLQALVAGWYLRVMSDEEPHYLILTAFAINLLDEAARANLMGDKEFPVGNNTHRVGLYHIVPGATILTWLLPPIQPPALFLGYCRYEADIAIHEAIKQAARDICEGKLSINIIDTDWYRRFGIPLERATTDSKAN